MKLDLTQEEIIVFNERCAEVVGAEYNPEDNRYTFQKELTDTEYTLRKSKRHHREQMCFHSDWNWIMEVVEAIESFSSDTRVIHWSRQSKNIFNIKITEAKKEAVIQAINQFIIQQQNLMKPLFYTPLKI